MRIGETISSRRWLLHVCGAHAVCSQRWRTYKGRFEELSDDDARGKCFSLPKVVELMIPRPFLKSTTVDGADAIVHAVDTDFVGSKSDNIAMFDVSGVDGAILLIGESFQ